MSRLIDAMGMQFGRLVVVRRRPAPKASGTMWECRCSCGNTTVVRWAHLREGSTISCGCWRMEHTYQLARTFVRKHGHCSRTVKHPLYRTWSSMWQRCTNPKNTHWEYYGARGISVSDRWSDFSVFLSDMGDKPSPTYTLDRINNDGNYEPDNCRWATKAQQSANRRLPRKRVKNVANPR